MTDEMGTCGNCRNTKYIIGGEAFCYKGKHSVLYVCLDWKGKEND